MHVFTGVSTIRACPEPTVFSVFDSFDKEFADLVGCGLEVTVFGEDDFLELLFIPVVHAVIFLLGDTSILVQILLFLLAFDVEVV